MYSYRWIKLFSLCSVSIIILISLFNWIINPYNVFNHGLDSKFPDKSNLLSDRMSKFYIANQRKPETIIMGTSRSGLFSEKQLEPYASGVYNYSLAGSSVDEQAQYIHYMITHHHIKTLVWSLDFFSFNPDKPMDQSFDSQRLNQKYYLNDYFISLFSFKTFHRSTKTLIKNLSSAGIEQDISGQPYTEKEIDFNIRYTLRSYATEKSFLLSEKFKQPHSIDKKLLSVQRVVDLCEQYNVKCVLYTSPVYHKHIDMIYSLGLGETFEMWKNGLAKIHPYTDFCTHNSITNNKMNFRDSSHVIGDLGKVIFAKIFLDKTLKIPEGFGDNITPSNVSAHIRKQKELCHPFSFDDNSPI